MLLIIHQNLILGWLKYGPFFVALKDKENRAQIQLYEIQDYLQPEFTKINQKVVTSHNNY